MSKITMEISAVAMGQHPNGDYIPATDHRLPVEFYDVIVVPHHEDTGISDPVEEFDDLTQAEASDIVQALEVKYGEIAEWR